MSGVVFLIMSLAAYRITRFVTLDGVPLFRVPRERLLRRWTQGKANDWKAEGITCPWCVGFYVSGLVVLIADWVGHVWAPGLTWLGVSTVVGLVSSNLDGPD